MALLDLGRKYTLRPMQYPKFYEYYKNAIKNTWTVEEISFTTDLQDLRDKITPAEKHVINRLIAFFATGDNIVGDNLAVVLRKHVNAPEAKMFYDRQAFEESLHVDFYLLLLDNYLPDIKDREMAFSAIDNIPSIRKKAEFCFKWMDQCVEMDQLDTDEKKKTFLINLITFASAIEGLFFFGAFAYVYYMRSKGLLHGLASGTNWVFRDESMHMNFAFDVVDIVKKEYPHLWDADIENKIRMMLQEAIDCELQFAEDTLQLGIAGLSLVDMKEYLQYVADSRLVRLGLEKVYNSRNPFKFMELQDLAEHTNFFERVVSQYSKGITGKITLNDDF